MVDGMPREPVSAVERSLCDTGTRGRPEPIDPNHNFSSACVESPPEDGRGELRAAFPASGQADRGAWKELGMTEVSSRNLQVRLLILVFMAFIPALGVFWYANRELRALQLEAKEQELLRRAGEVATDYERMIQEGEAILGALSEFEEISSARSPVCTQRLGEVLEHTEQFTTISVIGLDGYIACGSIHPETPLYLGDRAYYVRANSRGIFSVGEFTLGRITGRPVVGMARPLDGDGENGAVLAASMDLNALASRSGGGSLPEGFTFSVLDSNQRVLVRMPRTGDFTLADSVGAIAGADFPAPPEAPDPFIQIGTDLDGVERLFAVASLRSPTGNVEGYLAFGRTRMTLMQEVDEIVSLQLRFLAMGGIALLALAWALGHFWLARCPPEDERT